MVSAATVSGQLSRTCCTVKLTHARLSHHTWKIIIDTKRVPKHDWCCITCRKLKKKNTVWPWCVKSVVEAAVICCCILENTCILISGTGTHIAEAAFCDFVVFQEEDKLFVQRIYPDAAFWEVAVRRVDEFYVCGLLTELLCWTGRDNDAAMWHAISTDTGRYVDVEVLSNICHSCIVWENGGHAVWQVHETERGSQKCC